MCANLCISSLKLSADLPNPMELIDLYLVLVTL